MPALLNCQWYRIFFVTLAQISLVLKPIDSHVAFMENMESIEFKKLGLGSYLRKNIDSFGDLKTVEKFGTGQSNPTYKLETSRSTYVLRAKPPGELLKSAHAVDREYRVIQALKNTPVAVPKVFFLSDTDENPLGRMFYIMEHLEGRIFWDPSVPEVSKKTRSGLYNAMCKILADLHSVDIEKIGLSDFGKPGNYFARQTDRWVKQYRISRLKEDIVMEKVITFLENNLPLDDEQISLVHGDYRLDNMIFDNNHPKIIGLLDWELSTLGHPLADLAYQCMQWRLPYQSGMRGLNGLNRTELGIPLEEEYVDKYCEIRGISKIDNWNFYLVFSFFRLAAILEGVVMRAREGNASNPERAKKMSVAIPVLINMAAQLIKD